MLPDKVKLKISHEQTTTLLAVITDSFANLDHKRKQKREKMMVIALLKEIHKRLSVLKYLTEVGHSP